MMVEIGSMRVMDIMADATNTIAEGEVLQLLNCHDPDTTEARYLEVIHNKTAKLFESAARLGAVISDRSEAEEQAMAAYGMHLGCAFQLIDDVLDYTADSDATGKNVGDDLAEGKPTLPLIHAMRKGSPTQAEIIRQAIEHGGLEVIDQILATIESTGAIDYTARSAKAEADQAVEALSNIPASEYKDALIALAHFAVNRNY
jgi:octaprenyl-diphosphate synthase